MDPLSFENDPLLGDLPLTGNAPLLEASAKRDVDDEPRPVAVEVSEVAEAQEKTDRDLQRGALQEFVELATRCASLEIENDAALAQAAAGADAKDKRAHAELEYQYRAVQEQLAQKRTEKLTEIDNRYHQASSLIRKTESSTRQRIRQDFDATQADVKKQFDSAVWLAESVLEAAEGKIADDLKKAMDLHAAQVEQLTAKENEVKAVLYRYNQEPPVAPAAAPTGLLEEAENQNETSPEAAGRISFPQHMQNVDVLLEKFSTLRIANLLVGAKPYFIFFVLLIAAVGGVQGVYQSLQPQWAPLGISIGVALAIGIILLVWLRRAAHREITETYLPLNAEMGAAHIANEDALLDAKRQRATDLAAAEQLQKNEVQKARETAAPVLDGAARKRDTGAFSATTEMQAKTAENESQRAAFLADLERRFVHKEEELKQNYQRQLAQIEERHEQRRLEITKSHAASRAALEQKWNEGLIRIRAPMSEKGNLNLQWNDPNWETWESPENFPATVRFGQLQIDPKQIISEVTGQTPFTLPLPETFEVPALMAFPRQASMLIHTDRAGRMDAIRAMQMLMTRLLTSLPAGRVRFTLIDPVGLGQNFAGFMHLADYDEALVGGRIWTDAEQIDQRLGNLTEHMETVIQKYLRNEFATIDDYNQQAGELAEPYRFLVISDFPVNFSDEAFRRLSSIATTGARCGVYTLIMRDTRVPMPANNALEDLQAHSINLVREDDRFVWRDEVFSRFPLTIDPAPSEDELTAILHKVGKGAKEARRVEVPFDSIAPKPAQFWTMHSSTDLGVPVGRSGATRLQTFRMGRGVAQHGLIAGKTGSGKSTLLHALIANLAMWYSPDEIELYLIDFKKGVEFKTYATHQLPHARAIAVESDREFGLSVLQRIDAEMSRRGDLYRKFGVQDLAGYRQESKQPMPRTLLIIDEFQEFFTEDDKLAQDAALLLDRLVRQGRAFGVHLLLGSQTIGGSSGLSRSTIGQIAIRIALQTSEADSQLILGDGNSAARLLSRPGEAIYNDAGGLVEGNSPFQVAWLPDEQRDVFLEQVTQKVRDTKWRVSPPIVFEGNAAADFRKNPLLMELLGAPNYQPVNSPPQTWVGEPVAIKAPTFISFRRQSGANMLIIGQNEEASLAMVSLAMVNLAAQLPPAELSFYMMDGTPSDSPWFGILPRVASSLPHKCRNVDYREVGDALHELTLEMHRRQAREGEAEGSGSDKSGNPPAIFVVIYRMQRYRALRKSEDSFSFSSGDAEKPPDPGKEFSDLMRDGPAVGIHIISWIDTATALDRALDRGAMREFDHRVLFQMSATDSSNLIDSPAANKLGIFRALAYSEEQGVMEKFRPYAQPDGPWLGELKALLARKASGK